MKKALFLAGAVLIGMLAIGCPSPVDPGPQDNKPAVPTPVPQDNKPAVPTPPPAKNTTKALTAFGFTAGANEALSTDVAGVITDKAVSVIVPFGTDLTALKATFTTDGNAVSVGETPQVQSSTANDYTNPVVFRITAEDGTFNDYTVTVSFTTVTGLSPADGAATVSKDAVLSWAASAGADGYEVQIAGTAEGLADSDAQKTAETSFAPEAYPSGKTLFWRVRALSGDAPASDWSSAQCLNIRWQTRAVELTAPGTGETITDTTPTLTWESHSGAVSYELQIGAGSTAVMTASDAIAVDGAEYTFASPLTNETTYYWQVRGVGVDVVTGETIYSPYSNPGNFTLDWGTEGPADGIMFAEELAEIGKSAPLNGTYEINGELDLSAYENWTPIGTESKPFTGTLDGNDYPIKGLKITAEAHNQGLFGYISGGVVLQNVNLEEIVIDGGSLNSVGGLVGFMHDGTVDSCKVSGDITTGWINIGGLIGGLQNGTVSNNISECSVGGNNSVGGLIGLINSATTNSISVSGNETLGTISGKQRIGGLIGALHSARIEQYSRIMIAGNIAKGSIFGETSVGGLIGDFVLGYSTSSGNIKNIVIRKCSAEGDVDASSISGGLIGNLGGNGTYIGGTVEFCSSSGNVSSAEGSNVGGLVGHAKKALIRESWSTGNVLGNTSTGGLLGDQYKSTIINCYSRGDVAGASDMGGGIGSSIDGSIINCYSTGTVVGTSSTGGFISNKSGTITSCFYDETLSGQSDTGKGIPKTSSALKLVETYTTDGHSWAFADDEENGITQIWAIDEDWEINDGYPYIVIPEEGAEG